MTDRERLSDTDPMGIPVDRAATDPGGEEVTDPDDTYPEGLDALASEDDTEDFLRWLPTIGVGHRRRKELVRRPSSEGADFAAYACEGRSVAASSRVPAEAKVQVRTDLSPRHGSLASSESDEASEMGGRDAPTMVKRRRASPQGRALFGWGAVGLLTMGAAIFWWGHRPQAIELRASAAASVPLPLPTARTSVEGVETSIAVALTTGPRREAQSATIPMSPAAQRPTTSALPVKAAKEARRQGERAGAAPVERSPRAAASSPSVPIKDQYFEEP
jgi:hypothetical protein